MPDARFWQWLIHRCSSGCVLVFHDIAAQPFRAFISNLGLSRIVHLDELVQRARQRLSTAGLFAITVDDGVGVTVRELSDVMIKNNWPGTFFLPTAYLDSGVPMQFQWWPALRPHLPQEVVTLPSCCLDLRSPHALEGLFQRLQHLWHTRPPSAYEAITQQLVDYVVRERGVPFETLRPPAPISWDEVTALSRNDAIRFESHGATHTAMSALSRTELERELRQSRDQISECTGRPCRHLAYPFGSPRSIGRLAPSLAAQFYESASTMTMGPVDRADPFLLPRIPVYAENSLAKARAKLLVSGRRFHFGGAASQPVAAAGAYAHCDHHGGGAS